DGNDTIDGDTGNDTITGDTGDDSITGGDGNDTLNGTAGDDSIIGGEGADNLNGGDGSDNLEGNAGSDSLFGQSGADDISGSQGNDIVAGGEGLDRLDGGVGLNMCDYSTGEAIVNSCVYDDAGPVLVSASFDSSVLDSGSSEQSFNFNVHLTDQTGVDWISVGCSLSSGSYSQNNRFYSDVYSRVYSPNVWYTHRQGENWVPIDISGDARDMLVSVPVKLPFGAAPGDYECWLNTSDLLGASVNYSSSSPGTLLPAIKVRRLPPNLTVADMPKTLEFQLSSAYLGISWNAPAYNGGSAITDFKVETSRDGGQSWQSAKNSVSTSTSLTVSGAAPGTTYLVRVAAVNAVGQSEWLVGSVTTLATTASAPKSLVSSNLGTNSVSLGWGLPDSNGGAAITDYQVEVASNGSNSWTVIPHAASNQLGFNVSNLLSGRTYQFRVAAVTSVGLGAYSNVITFTTLGGVTPNAPASFTVGTVKTTAASVSWSSVVATSKVSNYLVDVSTDGSTWVPVSKRVSTSTSLALSGLKLGTTYQIRVAAVNANGTGDYVYGSFTTLATVSTAPVSLSTTGVSNSGFILNWNAPSSNGGAAISDYVVEINGGGYTWSPIVHDPSSNTSITITGLNPGVRYSVRVKAVNSVGVSKASSTLNVVTLAVAPSAPVISLKSVSATGAVITWTAPNNGGAKISDYLAEVSTNNGQTWTTVVKTVSSSTTLTLKGLKTKTSYLVRISAKNSVGYSVAGNSLSITTP
ncbi:MAG: hypothetical protein EBT07_14045, partial [Actinobacteria bacterium]|nr:hypothetical protein [Actinomycetota bacterium]